MNYGMRCHDICPKADIDTVLNRVQNNGINQIQLAMGKSFAGYCFEPGYYSPGFARMIRGKLNERGIHVAVLGCYINPTNPNEAMRKEEIAKFIEHLKYAKIIGADMVGTETGRFSEDFSVVPETYTEENYQLLLLGMREIVAAAEKLGMVVGVEAVHDHTLCSPVRMKRFLDEINSPMVEAILDPVNLLSGKNYLRQQEVVNEAFSLYGDRITMLHVKDFRIVDGELEFEHVGEGLFDYANLFRNIKEAKPYITILLEASNSERCHRDIARLQKIYEEV